MTDPKQQPHKPDDNKPQKPDDRPPQKQDDPSRQKPDDKRKSGASEEKVYVRNNSKTPYVVPGSGVTIAARRVTAVTAEAWDAFKETEVGQSLADDGTFEEVSEDELHAQPKTQAEEADEADAAANKAANPRGEKKDRK